jgi:hypothetical protein
MSDSETMNAKKYTVAAILLSTVLVAFAASLWQTKRGVNSLNEPCEPSRMALSGPAGKFGRVIDTVLPAAKTNGATDILNLETGRALLQPPLDLNSRADVIMAWIRSNGLDISCSAWPASAACVTHDMAIVAVEAKCWENTTEEEILTNPALAARRHHPRRLLVLGQSHPDTYVFRTGEGTLGMLRITGLSQDGQGVNIRYKLINPLNSENSIAAR